MELSVAIAAIDRVHLHSKKDRQYVKINGLGSKGQVYSQSMTNNSSCQLKGIVLR